MKVCSCEQMRNIDKRAENEGGIPSIVLMENAALSCVGELVKLLDNDVENKAVAVYCGKGNNGGDGLAIARHLYNMGADVTVCLVCGNEYKGDALVNYEILTRMGVRFADTEEACAKWFIKSQAAVVDAIFGTGVRGSIDEKIARLIDNINEYSSCTLSVDIPSGINGDSGKSCGTFIKADKTVTFAAYKTGLLMFPGSDAAGEIVVKDISIPKYIIESGNITVNVTDEKTAAAIMPSRRENSHKGNYGKVVIIGGSEGMTGAVVMAAEAAVKSGAGLVTAALPQSLHDIAENKLTEAMTVPLDDECGMMSKNCLPTIESLISKADAVLFGAGAGRGIGVRAVLEYLVKNCTVPLVIDADGLNVLAEDVAILKQAQCEIILTPHTAELARLMKRGENKVLSFEKKRSGAIPLVKNDDSGSLSAVIAEIESDRLSAAKAAAEQFGACVVLKGHHTIVTGTDGVQYINITGNSGMATGGSGDVLGGMTAAFAARKIPTAQAAALAVYLHGAAGDAARDKYGADSVTAGRIIENISTAITNITYRKKSKRMI